MINYDYEIMIIKEAALYPLSGIVSHLKFTSSDRKKHFSEKV